VIITVPAFGDGFRDLSRRHPEWRVGPELAVIRGPRPTTPVESAPRPAAVPGRVLVGRALFLLALFAGVGVGWTTSLLPYDWFERAALAPAVGSGALVVGGVVADRLGMHFDGPAAWAVVLGVAVAGWTPWIARTIRTRRDFAIDRTPEGDLRAAATS
jgi:hypothetical protein